MSSLTATIDLLSTFADPTRVRLVALLARHELSVAELTTITELPQSRVSTHLGRLRDAGVLRDRRSGTSTFYSINAGSMPAGARSLWQLVSDMASDDVLSSDRTRAEHVVRERRAAGGSLDSLAGEMERHYSPGRTWESMARGLLGLVRLGNVLDVGAGDGALAEMLAPRADAYTCVEHSAPMLAAARKRLARLRHVRVVDADAHELPFPRPAFDQVLLFNVLTLFADPARALAEAARVLRAGGTMTIVTLARHHNEDAAAQWGHIHPGFEPAALAKLLAANALDVSQCGVTSRERRAPHFEVITAFATRRPARGHKRDRSDRNRP